MKILAIETSCDETAAAVVEDGNLVLSSSIATSKELHERTGGIVPEVAARKQVDFILPVIKDCLEQSNLSLRDIDKFAVTVGPGLIGSLVVGVSAAKSLAFSTGKELIPVNHLIGHLYANWLNTVTPPTLPAIALIVSGGHTDLVYMKDHGDFEYLGGTLDDAAGEAFDKTARLLNLKKYLGGVEISKIAATINKSSIEGQLPRPKIRDLDFDFSFSGLKSAVKRLVDAGNFEVSHVAKEFEDSIVEVLVSKTMRAVVEKNAKTLLLGGGVSANAKLRAILKDVCSKHNIKLYLPPAEFCTDSATYIASCAYFNQRSIPLEEIEINPSLGVMDYEFIQK